MTELLLVKTRESSEVNLVENTVGVQRTPHILSDGIIQSVMGIIGL